MVASHLNGVPLKGFDAATIGKLLTAVDGELTLTIIGKGDVKLRRAIVPPEGIAEYTAGVESQQK